MASVTCPGCLERDQRIAALERRVADLEAQLREALARLGINATNSSAPALGQPARQRPSPSPRSPPARSPGGQPGHPAHLQRRLPPERLTRTVPFVPTPLRALPRAAAHAARRPGRPRADLAPDRRTAGAGCRGHRVPGPLPHLPRAAARSTTPPIPSDLKAHSVGPRLAATLAYLTGSHHVSQRGLEEIAEDVFEVPLSLGTVAHLQAQMSAALAPAHAEAVAAVRAAAGQERR